VLSYNIATEITLPHITLASGRELRVGSPVEKGGVGEARGCCTSERCGERLSSPTGPDTGAG
jgi:hypothetical protein